MDMDARYSKVAIGLHWVIALSIIGMLGMGFFMDDMPNDMKPMIYGLHKSTGLTILVLSVVMIVWRLMHKAPPLPQDMKPYEKIIARVVFVGLYGIMLAIPFTGWALVSASPRPFPIEWYGLFEWPKMPWLVGLENGKDVAHSYGEIHETLAVVALGLIGLHIAAALRHHIILKDDILQRMAPWVKRKSSAE